jgi:hypothetical protein
MRIKIHGGTVQNGQSSLCHTCWHSTVLRGARLREMEETAWILRTGAKRHRVGFVPPKDLKPKDRFVLEED